MDALTGEVTELLQQLIRNECVNDGTRESGHESRNADTLAAYLQVPGVEMERFEPVPGRASLVARIEGSDPGAPSLLLMGHTDVVPVSVDGWREDPFGGELIDGEVWGRGAVDMLNLTSSMAVAFRHLALDGFRPKGTLTYLGVADEEALGTHGAGWLLDNERDAVWADFVVTEFGGLAMPLPSASGPKVPIMVGEKGAFWRHLRIHGTPGHGSMPLRTDNALVTAAEVVRRIDAYRPQTRITEMWRRFVEEADLPEDLAATLLDPDRLDDLLAGFPDLGVARMVHACTHTTIAPTVMHAGVKTNIIPDTVELQLDIRTLAGDSAGEVEAMLREALGELSERVEVMGVSDDEASESEVDTPLWVSLSRVIEHLAPGSRAVPFMIVGATDARFFRRAGATAYGAGLFSDRIAFTEFMSMFHGDNERVDVDSLRLSAELWEGLVRDLLGQSLR
jgi:acetylornithine deacetylase/succinyl-diaminopimelate desuccinylase-like protein